MTILFTEGFDNQGASDGATFHKWGFATNSHGGNAASSARSLQTGRFGSGSSLLVTGFGGVSASSSDVRNEYILSADAQTIFCGFGFQWQGTTLGIPFWWLVDNLAANQLDIRLDAGLHPFVTRNGTTLCTSSVALAANAWFWIELGAFISPTVGWAELRIATILTASYYGTTGTNRATANGNTRASSISSVRTILHGLNIVSPQSATYEFDDIVINNSSGSVNNDFLGDVRVIGSLPTSAGAHSEFTRVGGTISGNYTAVNENPINGDTSYVSSPTLNATDTYVYPALSSTVTQILAVIGEPVARRDDAGSRSIISYVRNNSAEATSPTGLALPIGYTTAINVMETNPVTTLAWQLSDVNSGEFGNRVSA